MATEDARYRTSTQFRLWSFSPTTLASLRSSTNSHAAATIAPRLPLAADTGPPPSLTPDEELMVIRYYTCELLRAGAFCDLPTEVRATAAVFLRRFYITNSVMTYPPTEMLKTSLFFGAKAEGLFGLDLGHFAHNFPKTTPEMVLAGEYLLCQGIRFAFDVRHPFRALEGAIVELNRLDPAQSDRISTAHIAAREILKFSSLVTDAYFHYTPSQIMLAALSSVDEGLADILIERSFPPQPIDESDNNKPHPSQSQELKAKAMVAISDCRKLLEEESPQRFKDHCEGSNATDQIRPLLKKLRKCRDPDRANLVALQQARREQVVNKEKEKQPGLESDDVFGGSLQ